MLATSIHTKNFNYIEIETQKSILYHQCASATNTETPKETHIHHKIVQLLVVGQVRLEKGVDLETARVLVVLEKGPELLQAVQLLAPHVAHRLGHEVAVDLGPELALQAVAVEAEQALQPVPGANYMR